MLSFHLNKEDVKEIITQFCESHALTQEQTINLISKIANYGENYYVNGGFDETGKRMQHT